MNRDRTGDDWVDMAESVAAEDFTDLIHAEAGTAPPPEPGEPMVVRSLRLPVELHRRLNAVADRRGIPASTLMRQAIELELESLEEEDQPISKAEAVKLLRMLRPMRGLGGGLPHAA
ncbi:hypothetical protein LX16_1817 [Stackebrandtia albiflava]|uniref:Ribbon-helix-helix CopG family protein n=1 Tax=Stackebrandtia albiflava TaxID=406432 RepID=A0A562VE05_9ACTN|nr:ribbon-helix-helix protein, CopG family [Stackebrandtia albiflava]TWJ16095.1 hypothetical protein LX16_1817 [Stackebrandtia albiflava]